MDDKGTEQGSGGGTMVVGDRHEDGWAGSGICSSTIENAKTILRCPFGSDMMLILIFLLSKLTLAILR